MDPDSWQLGSVGRLVQRVTSDEAVLHLILPPSLSCNVWILATAQRHCCTCGGHAPAAGRASAWRRTPLQLLPLLTSVHAHEPACTAKDRTRVGAATVSHMRTIPRRPGHAWLMADVFEACRQTTKPCQGAVSIRGTEDVDAANGGAPESEHSVRERGGCMTTDCKRAPQVSRFATECILSGISMMGLSTPPSALNVLLFPTVTFNQGGSGVAQPTADDFQKGGALGLQGMPPDPSTVSPG
jgi:hypothetical protein